VVIKIIYEVRISYNKYMKILITGAHFTAAVAVIEELQKTPNTEIVYVGRKSTREGDRSLSPESQIIPEMGIKFIPITTGRLQRALTIYTLLSLLKIPIGFIQSLWILFTQKPDRVLSFGGYVAVPVVITGWLMSIPVIIHEQTLVTGLANKICSWFSDKILVSFDTKNDFPPEKVILTGNPLRKEILEAGEIRGIGEIKQSLRSDDLREIFFTARKEKKPVIFVTGGNQGSHVINLAVENCLDKLTKLAYIIHQTGNSKFKDFERLEKKLSSHYFVSLFFYQEMPYLLKHSDLVISRAGINTLMELAYFGTPALVIPVPYLYKGEQNQNAKYFESSGLVKILPQSKLSGDSLLREIKGMGEIKQSLRSDDLRERKDKAKKAKSVVIPEAGKIIALETLI